MYTNLIKLIRRKLLDEVVLLVDIEEVLENKKDSRVSYHQVLKSSSVTYLEMDTFVEMKTRKVEELNWTTQQYTQEE